MSISANDVFAAAMSDEEIAASDNRTKELLDEFDTLQKLRKAKALTQEALAQRMGKKQVSVAQLEKRSDILLSTLREYVQALGGELDLVVRFKGQNPLLLAGFGDESLSHEHGKASKKG